MGNVSEVDLSYKLAVKSEKSMERFCLKLYLLENSGEELEIELDNHLETIQQFSFMANEAKDYVFRLEISKKTEILEENIEIFVEADAVQSS